ncbi:MAG: porin family protein [Gemmatimonadota bacterium]
MRISLRSVLVAACVLAFGAVEPAAAQPRVELGLTGGYNLTDWALGTDMTFTVPLDASGESLIEFEPGAHHTFSFGAMGVVELASALALQTEALYTRRGIRFREPATLDDEPIVVDAAYETSYVQVPLLLRVSMPPTGRITPFLTAGPAVGFEWGSWVKGTVETAAQNLTFDQELNGFESRDYGVVFGGGGLMRYDGGTIYLNLRYDLGLRSIIDTLYAGDDTSTVKNRALGVLFGFTTQLGG